MSAWFRFQPFPVVKMGFKVGMKLEGIDPQHPSLYCVLTVAEIRGFRLRLHFDEYSECFDFWTNADSPFIFPAGWVEKNGKVLQPPLGKHIFCHLSIASAFESGITIAVNHISKMSNFYCEHTRPTSSGILFTGIFNC